MKTNLIFSIALFFAVFAAGCASNKPADGTGAEEKVLASIFEGESVQVFVEGRDQGFTPMTLRVRRSLGEYNIALKKGKEVVRKFELGLESNTTSSPERQAIYMDLQNDNSVMGLKTFNIHDLESRNDTLFFIPNYNANFSIDDVQYGLTLLVTP